MQSSYSIEFNIFSDSSAISHGIYPRAVFISVFALHPEVIIQGQLL